MYQLVQTKMVTMLSSEEWVITYNVSDNNTLLHLAILVLLLCFYQDHACMFWDFSFASQEKWIQLGKCLRRGHIRSIWLHCALTYHLSDSEL